MPLKSDANEFKSFLNELALQDWVRRSERRWWPHFLFHYTDIQNAVQILKTGYLYSRKYLEDKEQLIVSSGSSTVLAQTNITFKDCVRFYFRPKTPTQYHAEGIYSTYSLANSRFPDAHCPVPIFFLFDAASLLSRTDCFFSNGNLSSSQAQIFSSADEFKQLPWKYIYHNTSFDYSTQSTIIFHRHAEAIIQGKIDLNSLKYIYCRSEAELETFSFLLRDSVNPKKMGKIITTTRADCYYRRQTYIETIRLSRDWVDIQFSPETKSPGPFILDVVFKIEGNEHRIKKPEFSLHDSFNWRVRVPEQSDAYTVKILLDNNLAYNNSFEDTDIPF